MLNTKKYIISGFLGLVCLGLAHAQKKVLIETATKTLTTSGTTVTRAAQEVSPALLKASQYLPRQPQAALSTQLERALAQVPAAQAHPTLAKAPALLEDLQAFVALHDRAPKPLFFDHRRPIPIAELDETSLQEIRLARQVFYVLKTAKKLEIQSPVFNELNRLYHIRHPRKCPTAEEVLAQTQAWMKTHGAYNPRTLIYQQSLWLTNEELSAEELEEVRLGRHIVQVLRQATQETPTIRELKKIRQLPSLSGISRAPTANWSQTETSGPQDVTP